MNIEKKLPTIH